MNYVLSPQAIAILHERMLIFNSFLLLLRRQKGGKTKAKNRLHSVIYLLYNSK